MSHRNDSLSKYIPNTAECSESLNNSVRIVLTLVQARCCMETGDMATGLAYPSPSASFLLLYCHLVVSSVYKLSVSPPPTSTVVITVEVWIITPRSVDCPPSQRNATTARASHTWWLSVPTRRWRPVLRTNTRLPRPSVQEPRPTSTVQRRRSRPARLHWRGHPPPRRSPTHEGPGPRGGGNPENNLEAQTCQH